MSPIKTPPRHAGGRNGQPAGVGSNAGAGRTTTTGLTAAMPIPGRGITGSVTSPSSASFGRQMFSSLTSYLVDRWKFAQSLYTTYAGKRNIYSSLGYIEPGLLTYAHFKTRYDRGGVAKRIVDSYPRATWAGGARIVEDPDPNTETEFERQVRILFDRLDVWSKFMRADMLAQIGQYSVLLLGAPGDLESPLPEKIDKLSYINVIPEDRAWVVQFDDNANSPTFGLPLFYTVQLGGLLNTAGPAGGGSVQQMSRTARVHASRIIHVADGLLDNEIFGTPILRAPWNYLDDLDKIVGGGAEAAWKRMDPGMQIDVDPELDLGEGEEEAVEEQIDEYQHDLRRTIQTRGTKINLLASQVQGFGPNANLVLELVSATTGIPQRILLGSERGELASTQDRSNWADRIQERRRTVATPIIRQFLSRLIERGVLPMPDGMEIDSEGQLAAVTTSDLQTPTSMGTTPGGYEIIWPDVGQVSLTDRATIANKLAVANQAQFTAGLAPIATADEIRHIGLGMGPLKLKAKDFTPIVKAGAVSSSSTRGDGQAGDANAEATGTADGTGNVAPGADNRDTPPKNDGTAQNPTGGGR